MDCTTSFFTNMFWQCFESGAAGGIDSGYAAQTKSPGNKHVWQVMSQFCVLPCASIPDQHLALELVVACCEFRSNNIFLYCFAKTHAGNCHRELVKQAQTVNQAPEILEFWQEKHVVLNSTNS